MNKLIIFIFLFLPLSCFANPELIANPIQDKQTLQELYSAKNHPSFGNPNAKIIIVDFSDYFCSYCKIISPILEKIAKQNNQVKIIYIDYPIMNPNSEPAARAALAANLQNKYLLMHDALFALQSLFDTDWLQNFAKQNKLNSEKLLRDMQSDEVSKQLELNSKLAEQLQISALPMLYITQAEILTTENPASIPQYRWFGPITVKSFNAFASKKMNS